MLISNEYLHRYASGPSGAGRQRGGQGGAAERGACALYKRQQYDWPDACAVRRNPQGNEGLLLLLTHP